jgi:hypothetical protein
MEKLLHDSFANYVVQTSLDFADEDQRAEASSFFSSINYLNTHLNINILVG